MSFFKYIAAGSKATKAASSRFPMKPANSRSNRKPKRSFRQAINRKMQSDLTAHIPNFGRHDHNPTQRASSETSSFRMDKGCGEAIRNLTVTRRTRFEN